MPYDPAKSKLPTACFGGFHLSDCVDNGSKEKKILPPRTYQDDGKTFNNEYCVQCCRLSRQTVIAREVWNLTCPFTLANKRIKEARTRPQVFSFARLQTIDDLEVTECVLPRTTFTTYLAGYHLTIQVKEMRENLGFNYWTSVISCSATAIESTTLPKEFYEYIDITSVPDPTAVGWWYLLPGGFFFLAIMILAVPCYRGRLKGERCVNCGSWLVMVNGLCILCILCGCRLRPPPVKVFSVADLAETSSDEDDSSDSD